MLPKAPTSWTREEAAHLLRRAGFGGSPARIDAFHALGREAAVDSLLAPEEPLDAYPPPAWAREESAIEAMRARAEEVRSFRDATRGMDAEAADRLRRERQQAIQRESRQQGVEAQAWWFRRMLHSKASLREKMTLFWHDHFACSLQKVRQAYLMVLQNDLFRRHALGDFRALTLEVLRDPAMMIYLDSQNSKAGKPNENLARELFELFTLGVGNYSEEDIREAARALTGYQLNRLTGRVFHNRRQWDSGRKTIFGKTGPFTGEDVVALVFERPEPARFMARKLWEFFAYEEPSESAVDALAEILRKADYQTAPLLREMFLCREFYSPRAMREQIKAPVPFLIAMLHELEIPEPPAGFAINAQQQLGQTLFLPPNVAGWDWGQAWINTNTLLTRYNLAGFLTKGSEGDRQAAGMMAGGANRDGAAARRAARASRTWRGPDYRRIAPPALRRDPEALVDSLILRFFQAPLPPLTRETFLAYAREAGEPAMNDAAIARLCHLMLSTPHYQLA